MSPLALALVLCGAVLHATWNLSAKRAAGDDSLAFVWLMGLVSVALALPFGLASWLVQPPSLSPLAWVTVVASGAVHGVYFLLLQQGYRRGELSIVYPVARGTGPLFAVAAAVIVLGEHPGRTGWLGIAAILTGIVLISGVTQTADRPDRLASVAWGGLTGLGIATYTLIDALAVTRLGLGPLVFFFLSLVCSALVLAPFALRDRVALRRQWCENRRPIVTVGVVSPAAYVLVLFALQLAPLAYVAPLRELSMMVAVLYGAWLLREPVSARRLAGVVCMIAGVVGLALA